MACARLNDGAGPHWSCNQAIVQRAEEEADEEVQHWSDSDVSESELADAFREIQEVTNKMGLRRPHEQEKRLENAKKPATSMLAKPSRGPPILQLHVVMVIDASLSILVEHWFSRLNVVVSQLLSMEVSKCHVCFLVPYYSPHEWVKMCNVWPAHSKLAQINKDPGCFFFATRILWESTGMGTEDVDLLMDRKGSDVQLPVTVRRIDAVFHSCLSFLEAFRATNVTEERFSLVACLLT